MVIGDGKTQCSVCANRGICKNQEALLQFNKNVEKMKVGYPELKVKLVCQQFQATRYI